MLQQSIHQVVQNHCNRQPRKRTPTLKTFVLIEPKKPGSISIDPVSFFFGKHKNPAVFSILNGKPMFVVRRKDVKEFRSLMNPQMHSNSELLRVGETATGVHTVFEIRLKALK